MVMGMLRRIVVCDLKACARLEVGFPTRWVGTVLVPAGNLVAVVSVTARIEWQPYFCYGTD